MHYPTRLAPVTDKRPENVFDDKLVTNLERLRFLLPLMLIDLFWVTGFGQLASDWSDHLPSTSCSAY